MLTTVSCNAPPGTYSKTPSSVFILARSGCAASACTQPRPCRLEDEVGTPTRSFGPGADKPSSQAARRIEPAGLSKLTSELDRIESNSAMSSVMTRANFSTIRIAAAFPRASSSLNCFWRSAACAAFARRFNSSWMTDAFDRFDASNPFRPSIRVSIRSMSPLIRDTSASLTVPRQRRRRFAIGRPSHCQAGAASPAACLRQTKFPSAISEVQIRAVDPKMLLPLLPLSFVLSENFQKPTHSLIGAPSRGRTWWSSIRTVRSCFTTRELFPSTIS